MGSGVNSRDTNKFRKEHVNRAPSSNPPFTIRDIRKSIPPHCFKRSLLRSSSYLLIDLVFSLFFYYIAIIYIIPLSSPFTYAAWPIYWILQGVVQNSLFVIGHECAHEAFSDYPSINNTIGFFLHTAMLSPYFSWKYSHRRHHLNAASLQHDQNFVPKKKSGLDSFARHYNNPPGRVVRLIILCTIGWLLYIYINVTGREYNKFANHFDPRSPIYNDNERLYIVFNDIALLVTSYGLYKVAIEHGFLWLVLVYFTPLVIVYGFLVIYTWLQHTHRALPHYDSTEWSWLKGALSIVDRNYGALNTIFHHITDTHVMHHLFTTMPHYHLKEATEAVKPLLGEYYQFDNTPILKAMWKLPSVFLLRLMKILMEATKVSIGSTISYKNVVIRSPSYALVNIRETVRK